MKKLAVSMLLSCSMVFVACGDSDEQVVLEQDEGTIAIGGTLSGLEEVIGNGEPDIVIITLLASDGTESITLYEGNNGAFAFEDKLVEGETYAVSISHQPADQNCVITNGSGQAEGVNITNIVVDCN